MKQEFTYDIKVTDKWGTINLIWETKSTIKCFVNAGYKVTVKAVHVGRNLAVYHG